MKLVNANSFRCCARKTRAMTTAADAPKSTKRLCPSTTKINWAVSNTMPCLSRRAAAIRAQLLGRPVAIPAPACKREILRTMDGPCAAQANPTKPALDISTTQPAATDVPNASRIRKGRISPCTASSANSSTPLARPKREPRATWPSCPAVSTIADGAPGRSRTGLDPAFEDHEKLLSTVQIQASATIQCSPPGNSSSFYEAARRHLDPIRTITTQAPRSLLQRTVFINGKFSAQRMTGVQRVALNLVLALDQLLDQGPSAEIKRWVLLVPLGAKTPVLRNIETLVVPSPPGLGLHGWEQLILPWAARSGLLLNLAGAAPWLARRQVCMLHDAAVFEQGQAYSLLFRHWYRLLFRRLGRRALSLLVPSDFSRQRLMKHLGQAASRFSVLPAGAEHLDAIEADRSILDDLPLHGRPFFLAVASQNPTKNIDRLLAAHARMLIDNPIHLVIVGGKNDSVFAHHGSQPETPAATSTSTTAHTSLVIRAGAISDAQLMALYGAALAFIFPSIYEGFGLPPLEAMRAGCPVAVARAASLPEVCGDAALYFDPFSVESITASLQRLASSDAERTRLRGAGLRHAQTFTWQTSARRLLHLSEQTMTSCQLP
jgi:glycosyltransferase involved in cell wall biosynthesis